MRELESKPSFEKGAREQKVKSGKLIHTNLNAVPEKDAADDHSGLSILKQCV